MSLLSEFFFGSPANVAQLDLLEITHPQFTQDYRLVRNHAKGVTVDHEGGGGSFAYEYTPMSIKPLGSDNSLNQSLRVVLGDVGEIIQAEVEAVLEANGMNVRPVVTFRTYRSDDLSQPMFGPLTLEMGDVTTSASNGNSFAAEPPRTNATRTGLAYDARQFPMLRGF